MKFKTKYKVVRDELLRQTKRSGAATPETGVTPEAAAPETSWKSYF